MGLLITDPEMKSALIRQRRRRGLDRFDEVWNGVYVMSPLADDEHREVATNLASCFVLAIGIPKLGKVRAGVNVTDRVVGWRKNYRCPDVVVYLNGTKAKQQGSHWLGGPDFAVEVASRYDRSRQKFDFYARISTRELLIVDRYLWALELYRSNDAGGSDLVGQSTVEQPDRLASVVLPLTFHLEAGAKRPRILMLHAEDGRSWSA